MESRRGNCELNVGLFSTSKGEQNIPFHEGPCRTESRKKKGCPRPLALRFGPLDYSGGLLAPETMLFLQESKGVLSHFTSLYEVNDFWK